MTDTPQGAGWWLAIDGKWYPPQPEFTNELPSRPPTAAPDHPPHGTGPGAYPSQLAYAPAPPQRNKALFAVSAVAVVLLLTVVGLVIALAQNSGSNFRSTSKQYEVVVTDVVDSESINEIFLETFWQDYLTYTKRLSAVPAADRAAVTQEWLDSLDAQVGQFQQDLQNIDAALGARAFDNGTPADDVRDAAQAHYRSWQRWTNDIPQLAVAWNTDPSAQKFDAYIDKVKPELGDAISKTFYALCDSLSAGEPSDGSYETIIFDICKN